MRLGDIARGVRPWRALRFLVIEKGKERGRMVRDFRALNRQAERSRIPMPDISELMRHMNDGCGISGSDPDKVTVFKTMWPPMPRSLF